jgi:hypothetical protein
VETEERKDGHDDHDHTNKIDKAVHGFLLQASLPDKWAPDERDPWELCCLQSRTLSQLAPAIALTGLPDRLGGLMIADSFSGAYRGSPEQASGIRRRGQALAQSAEILPKPRSDSRCYQVKRGLGREQ